MTSAALSVRSSEVSSDWRKQPAFREAIELRDEIISLGWRRDLIAIEACSQNIANGTPPKGYRVVLAWSDGRLKRVRSIGEARRHLGTLPQSPSDVPGEAAAP